MAVLGLIGAAIYALGLVQDTFHGDNTHGWRAADGSRREMAILGALTGVTLWLGLYPQPVFDTAAPAITRVLALGAGLPWMAAK